MQFPTTAYSSDPDDEDLRTALRHVPILPAPTTIEDLLARVDQTMSSGSADLAEIILDARYPDMPGGLDWSQQDRGRSSGFYEPIDSRVNSSFGQSAPRHAFRLLRLILVSAAVCGTMLVAWGITTSRREVPYPLVPHPSQASEIEYVGIVSFNEPERAAATEEKPRTDHTANLTQIDLPGGVRQDFEPATAISRRQTRSTSKMIRPSRLRQPTTRLRAKRAYHHQRAAVSCGLARMLLRTCNRREGVYKLKS
jgi:hypothetical protein